MLSVLLALHLAAAFAALAAFWTAAASFKGGARHRRAGRWFAWLIYTAAALGATLAVVGVVRPSLLSVSDPQHVERGRQLSVLILYLLLVIIAPVQHGIRVVGAGAAPGRVRSLPHLVVNTLLLLGAFAMLAAGVVWRGWPFVFAAPAGFAIGLRNLNFANRTQAAPLDWEREHLTSLITAGIAIHTAFLALTSARWPALLGSGALNLIPWLGPTAVGLPMIVWLRSTRQVRPDS
jgi:hypothetical protein